jgi:hypothetical protein
MAIKTNLPATAVSGEVLTAAYVNALRGAFRVNQVIYSSYGIAKTKAVTYTTYEDTGLEGTITLQDTNNKVLVIVNQSGCAKDGGNVENRPVLQLVRGATSLTEWTGTQFLYTGTALYQNGSTSLIYLDTPGVLTAVTYKTQFKNGTNAANVKVQDAGSLSTMILMEISA